MNWSELGRQCNVPGANKGQFVKEIATKLELFEVTTENAPNVDVELLRQSFLEKPFLFRYWRLLVVLKRILRK